MSNPNDDSLHAPNPNHNVNPSYIFQLDNECLYVIVGQS